MIEIIVISPYATIWVDSDYYIIAKEESSEEISHFRIDYMKDIVILDRSVDMIFGGINPRQYADKFITQRGEIIERYDNECEECLWEELAETFGKDVIVIQKDSGKIRIKVRSIPTIMKNWVMAHVDQCEVLASKKFRGEIQRLVMEAYRKYW